MSRKGQNNILIGVLTCAIIWTIYSNLFHQNSSNPTSIAIGSSEIELAEEDLSSVPTESHQHEETDNHDSEQSHNHDADSSHNHEEHEHEHGSEDTHGHSEHDHAGHAHEIYTTEVNEVKKPAPQFITKTLDGETVKLSDFLGKKVIINFWTTWCPPCQEEIPELQTFYEEKNDEEVILLGLNITDEDLGMDVIHEFKEYYGITYPILLDEKGEITNSYDIITIPTTYVIDEKGNLEKQIVGPLTNEMLKELMNEPIH